MYKIIGNSELEILYNLQYSNKQLINSSSLNERQRKLKKLLSVILINKENILEALKSDLNKSYTEGELTEVFPLVSEIRSVLKNLSRWLKPVSVKTPLVMFGAKSKVLYQPKGMALIFSPWNYPFMLAMNPLVSAIAAGNCAIVKPSEKTPETSRVIKKIVEESFNENEVSVVEGGPDIAEELLRLSFDHIFFTGSPAVGKLVMKAASENLTSVTLELGGKSPAIVDGTFDVKKTAKRIIWGKFINAGQTCVAPDYILVKKRYHSQLVDSMIHEIKEQYYKNNTLNVEEYVSIIDESHAGRLMNLLHDAVDNGGKIHFGGNSKDDKHIFIEPTVISLEGVDNKLMKEEIFGPVLPVISYEDENDLFEMIGVNPNPLAMYVFSKSKDFVNRLLSRIASGGVTINDTLMQFVNGNLPFGGIGNSGMGKAHGYAGFKEFSNERAIVTQSTFSLTTMLYPPYNDFNKKLADLLVKYF